MKLSKRAKRNADWIEAHCYIPEGKYVGQPVELSPAQNQWLEDIYGSPTRRFILSMPRKNGKALALDTPIPTPNGWKVMGDISAGDYVYDSLGHPVKVVAESEIFNDKKCYKVGFSDGSYITASEDHIWTTRHKYRPWAPRATYANGKPRGSGDGQRRDPITANVTTKQIYETLLVPRNDSGIEYNHKIDCAKPLICEDINLPIDPYVLGYWLGDGTSASASFTCSEQDKDFLVGQLNKALGVSVVVANYENRASTIRASKSGLQSKLREVGLLGNKHIPSEYFDASFEQRLHLLQGLMDSDGTVNRCAGKTTPRCSFTNKNYDIAYGVWRLARTLGLKATIKTKQSKLNGNFLGNCWEVSFSASSEIDVFRLKRKQELLPASLSCRSSTIVITSCEAVDTVPTKCIAVDSEDHLYLAGHGCIPTHNTAFSAFIVLLHLVGPEAKVNSQLYSTANSKDQAAVLFNLAAKIVRLSPTLVEYVGVRDTQKHLYCNELGSVYKALSADSTTAMGMSPVLHISDESGQVRGERNALYEALETASAAQESPLTIVISTQAATDSDFLSVLIDDAIVGHDKEVKCRIYQVAKDDDIYDPEVLAKAQPNWHLMNHDEVLKMQAEAKRIPSKEAGFRNLICNQRVEATTPFINPTIWKENGQAPAKLDGLTVWGGLDLSSVQDLTALTLVSADGDVHCWFWLPDDGLVEKSRVDKVPYDLWRDQGYLTTTPGRSIDYDFVAKELKSIFSQCNVQKLAFDRYNMRFLLPALQRQGFTEDQIEKFVEFGQGFVSMSPAIREFESRLLNSKLKHNNNPILTMCAANTVVVSDPAGNRKFTKQRSKGRIDGMVSTAMAIGVMPEIEEQQSTEITQGFVAL